MNRTLWNAVRVVYVRLRFLLLLAVGGLVVGRWEDLRAWTDRSLDRIAGGSTAPKTISPDTEYFCPMCPGVVTRWPEKCPVCKMPLVRRKKGDAGALPYGVASRMQFSPYRVQLAGVRTIPVAYRPLADDIQAVGKFTASRTAEIQLSRLDVPWVRAGQKAVLKVAGGDESQIFQSIVEQAPEWTEEQTSSLQAVTLKATDEQSWPEENTACVAAIAAPLAAREPFASIPHGTPPDAPGEVRTIHTCPDHGEYLFLKPGKCPFDDNDLTAKPLGSDERIHWWCPAHPQSTALQPNAVCASCMGLPLLPRVVTYWPAGEVLAVPDTAVLSVGRTSLVFVESGPGMYDGRVVELGPAVDGFVSVVRGVAANERVVVTSTFLLDAETRLNPAVVAEYFGALSSSAGSSAAPATSVVQADTKVAGLDQFKLPPRDRALAAQQRICPVTRLPLGSMGAPIAVALPEQTFYLCCEGCRARLPKRTQSAVKSGHDP